MKKALFLFENGFNKRKSHIAFGFKGEIERIPRIWVSRSRKEKANPSLIYRKPVSCI